VRVLVGRAFVTAKWSYRLAAPGGGKKLAFVVNMAFKARPVTSARLER